MTTTWIYALSGLLMLAGAGWAGLRYRRRGKPPQGPCPKRVLGKLIKLNPISASISVSRTRRRGEVNGELGRVFFLRAEQSIYREKNCFYVTVPKAPKNGKPLADGHPDRARWGVTK